MNTVYVLIQITAIVLLSWVASLFLPWWTFVVITFISGIFLFRFGYLSFVGGFFGAGIYYILFSLLKAQKDNFIFADKIGEIMGSSNNITISGISLLFIGAFIFALLGGLFAWSSTLILSSEPSNRLRNGRARNKTKSLKLDLKRYK